MLQHTVDKTPTAAAARWCRSYGISWISWISWVGWVGWIRGVAYGYYCRIGIGQPVIVGYRQLK